MTITPVFKPLMMVIADCGSAERGLSSSSDVPHGILHLVRDPDLVEIISLRSGSTGNAGVRRAIIRVELLG